MKASMLTTAFALLAVVAAPAHAQSTGPTHSGFDPNAPTAGHYHVGEVGEKLMLLETALKCDCGCGLDVHSCQFQMQCGTSPVWSVRIRESLERGESVEAIEASFVADFGTAVLMSPPREGFNLVGYFLPAFGILTMGMLVGLLIRNGAAERERPAPVTRLGDKDEARLREALRKIDAEESPDW
ncbi:MAG: cytochrome c-type biogenesis protein CcmH [Gemmatimonadota bacterium]